MPTVERQLRRDADLEKDIEPAEKLIKKIHKEYRKVQKKIDDDTPEDEVNDTTFNMGKKKLLTMMKADSRRKSMKLLRKYEK